MQYTPVSSFASFAGAPAPTTSSISSFSSPNGARSVTELSARELSASESSFFTASFFTASFFASSFTELSLLLSSAASSFPDTVFSEVLSASVTVSFSAAAASSEAASAPSDSLSELSSVVDEMLSVASFASSDAMVSAAALSGFTDTLLSSETACAPTTFSERTSAP